MKIKVDTRRWCVQAAVCTTIGCIFVFQPDIQDFLRSGEWVTVTCALVLDGTTGSSLQKGIEQSVGCAIAAGVAFGLYMAIEVGGSSFAAWVPWVMAFVGVCLTFSWGLVRQFSQPVSHCALMATHIVLFPSVVNADRTVGIRRIVGVLIGSVLSMLVSISVFPSPASPRIISLEAEIFEALAAAMKPLFERESGIRLDKRKSSAVIDRLATQAAEAFAAAAANGGLKQAAAREEEKATAIGNEEDGTNRRKTKRRSSIAKMIKPDPATQDEDGEHEELEAADKTLRGCAEKLQQILPLLKAASREVNIGHLSESGRQTCCFSCPMEFHSEDEESDDEDYIPHAMTMKPRNSILKHIDRNSKVNPILMSRSLDDDELDRANGLIPQSCKDGRGPTSATNRGEQWVKSSNRCCKCSCSPTAKASIRGLCMWFKSWGDPHEWELRRFDRDTHAKLLTRLWSLFHVACAFLSTVRLHDHYRELRRKRRLMTPKGSPGGSRAPRPLVSPRDEAATATTCDTPASAAVFSSDDDFTPATQTDGTLVAAWLEQHGHRPSTVFEETSYMGDNRQGKDFLNPIAAVPEHGQGGGHEDDDDGEEEAMGAVVTVGRHQSALQPAVRPMWSADGGGVVSSAFAVKPSVTLPPPPQLLDDLTSVDDAFAFVSPYGTIIGSPRISGLPSKFDSRSSLRRRVRPLGDALRDAGVEGDEVFFGNEETESMMMMIDDDHDDREVVDAADAHWESQYGMALRQVARHTERALLKMAKTIRTRSMTSLRHAEQHLSQSEVALGRLVHDRAQRRRHLQSILEGGGGANTKGHFLSDAGDSGKFQKLFKRETDGWFSSLTVERRGRFWENYWERRDRLTVTTMRMATFNHNVGLCCALLRKLCKDNQEQKGRKAVCCGKSRCC